MAVIFEKKVQEILKENPKLKFGSDILRDILYDKAMQAIAKNVKPKRIIEQKKAEVVNTIRPGELVCYFYDAKHKATLPYWDKFPVVFPIEIYDDGFLGLNLHYLPPVFRIKLMEALHEILNNQRYDETSRLNINYKILKNASKFKYFKPCVKRYLTSHLQSRVVKFDVKEWPYAALLPLARFQKKTARKVWDDSINSLM